MQRTRRLLARLWGAERGISSVEYALLLAMIAGGIIISVDLLASAVSNEMIDAAALFVEDDVLVGDNCGSDGGAGGGSGNTCK